MKKKTVFYTIIKTTTTTSKILIIGFFNQIVSGFRIIDSGIIFDDECHHDMFDGHVNIRKTLLNIFNVSELLRHVFI